MSPLTAVVFGLLEELSDTLTKPLAKILDPILGKAGIDLKLASTKLPNSYWSK